MSIDFRIDDRIATVTLNRPEALNAIDLRMRRELQAVWRRIADDDSVAVAIVTGAGTRAFSAGADLRERADAEDAASESLTLGMECDKPLVCAFNGLAYGGGLEIGLGCDIRIAVGSARFAMAEVQVGTLPGSGGTQRLPRLIGRSDALRMLLTGDPIDAAEALRIGLVSELVPAERLQATALALARRIAANAPLAVRAVKHLVRLGSELPLDAALAAERATWHTLRDSDDRREGRAAFAAKRAPVYRGR
jgi:E-phenylitaconyl-CoA hydratase